MMIQLSGERTGEASIWTGTQIRGWLALFLVIGVVLRLVRFGLNFPLWSDEAYLAWNILDRDFAGLTRPLDYQQVCPILFLWAEKAITLILGFEERSLRLIPTLASIAGLFVFRHIAGRLLQGLALVIAVAFLAVAFTPIRHGGEVKPYSTDFLVALSLLGLALEWIRQQDQTRYLWLLAILGPFAIGFSNPSIFIVASVGLVLGVPVLRKRSRRVFLPWAFFGLASVATFLAVQKWINGPQAESVMAWMRIYWAKAFPPKGMIPLLVWLARSHTSQMFAYPAGGDVGASTFTTLLVGTAILTYLRRGSILVLALLLAPFGLGLVAAFLGRYPYGGSARTMQYVAPSIILLAGLGGAVWIARVRQPTIRELVATGTMIVLTIVGLGLLGWDMSHPYKSRLDQDGRNFSRVFWSEESLGAELVCARTDLEMPLDPLNWNRDRAALYLCHQSIYSGRHRSKQPPQFDRIGPDHPLRIVVFGERPKDARMMARWIENNASRFELKNKREKVLNPGLMRGRLSQEDRYTIYEFVPRQ